MWIRLFATLFALTAAVLLAYQSSTSAKERELQLGLIRNLPCVPNILGGDSGDGGNGDDGDEETMMPSPAPTEASICTEGGVILTSGVASDPISLNQGSAQTFCMGELDDDVVTCYVTATGEDELMVDISDETGVICTDTVTPLVCTVGVTGDELNTEVSIGAAAASDLIVTCEIDGAATCESLDEIMLEETVDVGDLVTTQAVTYCLPVMSNASMVDCTVTISSGEITLYMKYDDAGDIVLPPLSVEAETTSSVTASISGSVGTLVEVLLFPSELGATDVMLNCSAY